MAPRLLTVGLLLTALAWCGRAAAKPPDLPLGDKDTLTPQDPLIPVQTAAPSQPNPFPPAAEPAECVIETSWFYQIRPSARRMMASCLLFGVHPLLTLTPPEAYVDVDEDDARRERVIRLLAQSKDMRQLSEEWERFWKIDPPYQEADDPDAQAQPEQLTVMPHELPSDAAAESACPYLRQQQCAQPQEAPVADFDEAPDVLHNLQRLHQAQTLLDKAQELGRAGRIGEAAAFLMQAHRLCPGSRIDDAVQEAAVYLLVPFYCGSPSYHFGAAEEAEPPAEKTEDIKADPTDGCEECPGRGRSSICSRQKEREIEQKLALPVSVKFHDAPLSEVIDDLREWQDINICVDKAALDAEEISLDHPISAQFRDISLRSTLNLILKQAQLTYVIKDEVLQITTERAARGKLERVCYAVADLLEGDLHCPDASVETAKQSPGEALMRLITRTVCPQEWCEMGGPCTLDFHPLSRSLVVTATADVQEQIVDLLSALRRIQPSDEEEERQERSPQERCKAVLKACHAAMDAGRHREAADLAAKACALDPEQAGADPLVYKMHLAGDDADPVEITPCLPPVDPDTPAALEQLYRESLRSAPADGEEQEPPSAALPHGSFEFGFGLDGSVQMFGQLQRGGPIWHLFFGNGGLAVWAAPDGGAEPAPSAESVPDGSWDY